MVIFWNPKDCRIGCGTPFWKIGRGDGRGRTGRKTVWKKGTVESRRGKPAEGRGGSWKGCGKKIQLEKLSHRHEYSARGVFFDPTNKYW